MLGIYIHETNPNNDIAYYCPTIVMLWWVVPVSYPDAESHLKYTKHFSSNFEINN